jgi:hypothetical protein
VARVLWPRWRRSPNIEHFALAESETETLPVSISLGLKSYCVRYLHPKGSKLGRARLHVDMTAVTARRANGESLRAIARDLEISPALLVKRAKAIF